MAQSGYTHGDVRAMQIWSRALGADEVASLHALDGVCLATPTPAPTPVPTPYELARALDHSLCFDDCVMQDYIGGMHATLMNGATCTPGEGIIFDGQDDYVDLADQALGGPMTIAIWARWDALNSGSRLCDFGDGQNDDNIFIKNVGMISLSKFCT